MQGTKLYTIDLTKVNGGGEFRCPKCGIAISPNDETEDVYTILETVMKEDCLEKIILQCNSCGSQIHLVGFHLLNKLKMRTYFFISSIDNIHALSYSSIRIYINTIEDFSVNDIY